uniref:Putative secreted protein n=1 Tax=Ixodes ricinus TaxID=34613 RepID=A0A6B0TW65_IXORI
MKRSICGLAVLGHMLSFLLVTTRDAYYIMLHSALSQQCIGSYVQARPIGSLLFIAQACSLHLGKCRSMITWQEIDV